MGMFPAPEGMRTPRLQIANCGRDARSRHVFQLVFYDYGPCAVWTGYDDAAAILVVEVYARQRIEVVDAVVCAPVASRAMSGAILPSALRQA